MYNLHFYCSSRLDELIDQVSKGGMGPFEGPAPAITRYSH